MPGHPLRILLMTSLVAGVLSCGKGDETSATPPPANAPEATGGEVMNIDIASDPPVGMNNMTMPGTSAMSTANMPAMSEAVNADNIGNLNMTEQGYFRVSIQPELDPVPINQMHSWTLHVETGAGDPVDNAVITVAGGMPAHNHGMPTTPGVSRSLGNGVYLLEGIQFQMPGHWVIKLDISADGRTDSISLNMMLQP